MLSLIWMCRGPPMHSPSEIIMLRMLHGADAPAGVLQCGPHTCWLIWNITPALSCCCCCSSLSAKLKLLLDNIQVQLFELQSDMKPLEETKNPAQQRLTLLLTAKSKMASCTGAAELTRTYALQALISLKTRPQSSVFPQRTRTSVRVQVRG